MADMLETQCKMGVYPFMFNKHEDFLPIVHELIEV